MRILKKNIKGGERERERVEIYTTLFAGKRKREKNREEKV